MVLAEFIFLLTVGGLIILAGIFQIISGKYLTMSRHEHTADSVRKFARASGVLYICFGALVCLISLCLDGGNPILLGVLIACGAGIALFYVLLADSILKKKIS